jgi:hypothetical protein
MDWLVIEIMVIKVLLMEVHKKEGVFIMLYKETK